MVVQGASRLQKLNILYQMLATKGNEGDPPGGVLEGMQNAMVM
jgi:hypothetical protein